MKTPKNLTPTKRFRSPQFKLLALAALSALPAATGLAQTLWQGGTSDFNVAASWNGTYIDVGTSSPNPNCSDDSGSNNVVLIEPGDVAWYHGDTLAGNGNNTSGAYLQTGSTNYTGYPSNGNWLRLGIGTGAAGYYTLSNGVVNVAGETHMGEKGTGTLEVDGGVYNTGYNGNPGICAGDGDFGVSSGTLILNGGTINNINNETWFGEANSACTGYLVMNGGTFNANNWFVFGRNGAVGYGTMTGGTINFTGGGDFLIGGGGIGALAQSGGTINAHNQYLVPQSGGATGFGTNIVSGSAVLNVYSWLAVGRDSGYGELDISGNAAITRNDSSSHFDVGASAVGIVNQNGGAVTNLGAAVYMGESGNGTWNLNSGIANLGAVTMCVDGGAHGTFNLNGGLLQTTGINSANAGSTINFNGSMVQASGSSVSFISGVTLAQIGAGGVVFDSQAYNLTIPQEIDDNGGGTLTKIGPGTLILSGPNTYAGSTLISGGTLGVTTAGATSSSGYSVATGAAFSVQVASAGGQFGASALTFASGVSTLDMDLNTFGTPPSAPLNVGALTVNGTVTLNILAEAPVGIGAVPLVQYTSLTGSGSFVLGTLPPGETGYLSTTGGVVSLTITSAGAPRWNGNVNGVWDVSTTQNWIDLISGNPTTYHNGEPVLFDDTATGTTNVTLGVSVSPGSLTFNNTVLAYTLTGSGVIGGTTGLTKEGANTLALLNNGGNTYTGPTVIEDGILNVTNLANGGSPSAIGASPASATNLVLDGGTLSYTGPSVSINRGYDVATNSVIDAEDNLAFGGTVVTASGASFAKTGPAQLAYNGAAVNALAGSPGYDVLAGTVLFAGSGAGQTNTIAGTLFVDSTNGVAAVVMVTNAILNIEGSLTNGQAPGAGALVINNGGVVNGSGLVDMGDSLFSSGVASTGTVTQTGGAFNSPGQMWVGEGNAGVGTYTLSGGTLTMANWLAIGRANGTGTFNLSGTGVINDIGGGGGNLDIGTSAGIGGDTGTGVLNQTGGAITNTASQTWLGEGATGEPASGTWNMSGGTALLGSMYIGYGGDGTSAVNVSGTGVITCTGFLDVSPSGAATGNLNIGSASQPGGSFTVEGDMTLGDQGIGVVNMVTNGGGTLIVDGTLYLSRSSETADGTVNLNAGSTIVASYLNNGWGFHNNFSSPLDNPNAFNFNGGTLKANVGSQYFIQPYVNAVVQAGGAVINDNGFTITVLAALVNGGGGGGLAKLGSGTLYLTGVNTYTGPTTVGTGAFGSSGTIAGPVIVNSGATLLGDTGAIGTSSINNTLTLAAGSTTVMQITPTSNDEIQGLTGVTYGGALVVTNTGGALTSGNTYKLFQAAGPGGGNFSSVTLLPSGTATFNPATGLLTIGATPAPTLNGPTYSGGNLILTGSGGSPNGNYDVITATNLLTPLANWTTNVSGTFSATGTFSNNIPVSASQPAQFFRLAP